MPGGERRQLTGLEWGRALAILGVVGWHSYVFGFPTLLTPSYHGGFPDIAGGLYFNILLLAVPLFMSISLFLFIRQRERGETSALRRVRRLGFLAVFWIGLMTLTKGVGRVELIRAPEFVMSGNNSLFFFFVQLLLMTLIAEVALRLGLARRPRVVALALAVTVGLFLLRTSIANHAPAGHALTRYYATLNFLPYVFAMLGLHMVLERGWRPRRHHFVMGLAAYIGLAVAEWQLLPTQLLGGQVPPYARPSLVLGAALIMAVLVTGTWPRWRPVMLLAELSLAVYCVHIFVLTHLYSAFPALPTAEAVQGPVAFLLTMAITLAIAYSVRRRAVL
jgi:peptidoglycan/LPS O-acetylase OafA/YrhL